MRNTVMICASLIAGMAFSTAHADQSRLGNFQNHTLYNNANAWAWSKPDPVMQRRHESAVAATRTPRRLRRNPSIKSGDRSKWERGPGTRKRVRFTGVHKTGSVVISTKRKKLWYVLKNGDAMEYGIGVGRQGFTWGGMQKVSRKAKWPSWTPPAEMHKRQPGLPKRMEGGPRNPLGARALYLGNTLYRIHGTNQAHTIGHAVSSGCIRMMNPDVVDLYNRVPVGATVYVYQ
jgi:lipoprotein-anchoring transpeptidase ErfK/SrfK